MASVVMLKHDKLVVDYKKYAPYHSNIDKNTNNDDTLIICRNANLTNNFTDLANCESKEKYTQINITSIWGGKSLYVADLSKFTNLKVLYISSCNIVFTSLPDSLIGIGFRSCTQNIGIPYSKNIKYLFNLSSMGECFIDYTEMYHKYKLDNFDYIKTTSDLFYSHHNKNFTEDDLEKVIFENMNKPEVIIKEKCKLCNC
jgi:hypothetical protein